MATGLIISMAENFLDSLLILQKLKRLKYKLSAASPYLYDGLRTLFFSWKLNLRRGSDIYKSSSYQKGFGHC